MSARAVFLDRDGTLVHDPGFLRDPDAVVLLPGAAAAIKRLNEAGFLAIVATNQSGIARGIVPLEAYHAIERRIEDLLRAEGARLDAQYFCPHLPEISGSCDCRKPGTLMFRQAAERFGIDFTRSWWVGDRLRDVEPARALGGSGILIARPHARTDHEIEEGIVIAPSLAAAVDVILSNDGP